MLKSPGGGDPALSVAAQGTEGGLATGVPGQDVEARGILASTATRDQHTLTSVAPAGHLGSTCQQARLTKPPRRQKKKKQKQTAGGSAAASCSATTSSILTSAAGSPDEAATDSEMVLGRSDSSEEVVPAPGSAGQVDASEQEDRSEPRPSCSKAVDSGGSALALDRKRKSEAGPTPPQAQSKKKTRRGPAPGAYFNKAEEDALLGVVLVRDQPYAVLDRGLTSHLRDLLSAEVRRAVRSKSFVPTFNEARTRNNRFQVACSNQESYEWLEQVIQGIRLTRPGIDAPVRLCLVRPDEVPKLIRAAVYAPGAPSAPDFLELIQGQNRFLFTERWVLRHRQIVGSSTLFVYGIDGDSACILETINYSAHYELGRVTFQVARAQARSEGGSHD